MPLQAGDTIGDAQLTTLTPARLELVPVGRGGAVALRVMAGGFFLLVALCMVPLSQWMSDWLIPAILGIPAAAGGAWFLRGAVAARRHGALVVDGASGQVHGGGGASLALSQVESVVIELVGWRNMRGPGASVHGVLCVVGSGVRLVGPRTGHLPPSEKQDAVQALLPLARELGTRLQRPVELWDDAAATGTPRKETLS